MKKNIGKFICFFVVLAFILTTLFSYTILPIQVSASTTGNRVMIPMYMYPTTARMSAGGEWYRLIQTCIN